MATRVDTPVPSLAESRGSVDATSPASPADNFYEYSVNTKEEPSESNFPVTLPPAFENLDGKPPVLSQLDPTQHSAAMLCDLQCRSSRSNSDNNPASIQSASWWTTLFLHLMTLQFQIGYKTILLVIWTTSPSRMARLIQASAHRLNSRSTTSSMTPQPSRLTTALAQRNAATALVSRRGASALHQRSLIEARRAATTAAAEQQHHTTDSTKALEEQDRKGGLRDENSNDGVRGWAGSIRWSM